MQHVLLRLFRSCAEFGVDFARIFIRGVCNLYEISRKLHDKIHETQNRFHGMRHRDRTSKSTMRNFTEETTVARIFAPLRTVAGLP